MLKWIKKILDFGTGAPALTPQEKHSVRLINTICFFIATAKIIEDFFTFQLEDVALIIHSLFSFAILILVLYLNYRQKIQLARAVFTGLLLIGMLSLPFTISHSLNADGVFLVFLVIFFAIYTDVYILTALTIITVSILLFWHIADSYNLLKPIVAVAKTEILYLEIVYTITMTVLLLISLLSFKRSALDYQRELTQNIEQKDILIKEIHHRVKNNLQVIVSMLGIQENNKQLPETIAVIRDIKARVMAMSTVHNKLYAKSDFEHIELGSYVHELVDLLLDMHQNQQLALVKKINMQPHKADLTYSIPLGLIITEIISNAIKYAFKPNKPAVLEIRGERTEKTYILSIKDNGEGLDMNKLERTGLGFLLIDILCKQIDAKLERNTTNGLETIITFTV